MSGWDMSEELRRRVLLCMYAVVLVVGALGGLLAVQQGLERSRRHELIRVSRQFSCVERELEALVPAGTSVYVAVGDPAWRQRLATLASPRLRLVGDPDRDRPGETRIHISVIGVAPHEGCDGIAVHVRSPSP